jgi:DNA polymerase-4
VTRTILYAELPNFYANVERAENGEASDRPIIVGGDPRKRGLVQSASADALARGVALDMPMVEAIRRCPEARVFRTDMPRYREASRRLFAQLRREFDRLEPLGLGAAYFDLSEVAEHSEEIAERMRVRVESALRLPLWLGIGTCKLVARLAAEDAGATGVRRVPAGGEREFLHDLAATRIEGVGEKTAATLAELGARSIGEVAALGAERLQAALGTHGLRILAFAEGRDDRPVKGTPHPGSISREITLKEGSRDRRAVAECLQGLSQRLADELELQGLFAARVALKVRFSDQTAGSRSLTLADVSAAAPDILAAALALWERTEVGSRNVIGLAVQLAGLQRQLATDPQLELFPPSG